MTTRRVAMVACVALLMLAGCGDEQEDSQSAKDRLCEEVAELDQAAAEIAALEPAPDTATRIRTLRSELEAKYRDVENAAEDASDVRIEPVTQAYNKVLASSRGVTDQASLTQAQSQIDQAVGELSDARLQLHNQSRC